MRIKEASEWRPALIFISLCGMLCGAFFGRAILSISMIAFCMVSVFHFRFGWQVKQFTKSPLLFSMSLLFFIPFLSGLWSHNISEWLDVVRTKLPLFIMPLAFAGAWQLRPAQWKLLFYLALLLLAGGCCRSLWQYAEATIAMNESYLRAKSIPTPFENDHVRYSWMVALAAAACMLVLPKPARNGYRISIGILALFFIIYLHILSARTGLVCFYIFFIAYSLHWFFSSPKKRVGIVALFLLTMPLLAWAFLPTFQNRVRFMLYDFSFIKQQAYLPGGNDGNRVLSIKAGWHIVANHFFGVGAGDVRDASNNWYGANVPNMLTADKLLPSSEWLLYGAVAGWVGVIIFSVVMMVPFFIKMKHHRFTWMAVNGMAALSFLFDIGLEVQFGVFLYTFVILCCYKCLQHDKLNPA